MRITLVEGKGVAGKVELGRQGDNAGAAGGECSAHALDAIDDGVARGDAGDDGHAASRPKVEAATTGRRSGGGGARVLIGTAKAVANRAMATASLSMIRKEVVTNIGQNMRWFK